MIEKTFLFRESISKMVMVCIFSQCFYIQQFQIKLKCDQMLIYLDMEKMQLLHLFVLLLHNRITYPRVSTMYGNDETKKMAW